MKNNIVLIGMPGAGKSTVGVVLAKTLAMQFIDTDLILARRLGMTLQEYINRFGIEKFLEEEARCGRELECDDTVIATGGSMALRGDAMAHLKQGAVTVFLDLPVGVIKRRLRNIKTRGVAIAPGQTIGDLYRSRLPHYRKHADITVPKQYNPRMTIEDMVSEIVSMLPEAAKKGARGDGRR
jgi:shikimate kinase